MNKKKILFIYHRMMAGGSTSSLLSLLYSIDSTKYDIDLGLFEKKGELLSEIPEYVNILPEIKTKNVLRYILIAFDYKFWKAIFYRFIKKNNNASMQLMAQCRLHISRHLPLKYDAAIGYLECWPSIFISSNKVIANKRIAWIHTDYVKAGFIPSIDYSYFKKVNSLVAVSNNCNISLKDSFPKLSNKVITIENIVSKLRITNLANLEIVDLDNDVINFVVVCRMDIKVKGLDRMLRVFQRLEADGLIFNCNFIGADENNEFQNLLKSYHFLNGIKYLGYKQNPYPIIKNSDVCLQLSRFEGKPIVVDEALLLGIPVFASNYNSAHDQIQHNITGLVFENNEEDIYQGLKSFLESPELLYVFRKNLQSYNLNRAEKTINKFNQII